MKENKKDTNLSIMKNCILTLLIFQSLLVSCQKKKDLYLLFEEMPEKVYINPYEKSLGGFDIFTYRIKLNENYEKEIFFDPTTVEEEKIYIDSDGKYKVKLQQKEIELASLKDYDVKDYKWLKTKMNSIKYIEDLYKFYNRMYIVQIDSVHKKVILTEVINIEIVK